MVSFIPEIFSHYNARKGGLYDIAIIEMDIEVSSASVVFSVWRQNVITAQLASHNVS